MKARVTVNVGNNLGDR